MKNEVYPYYNSLELKNLQELITYCYENYGEKLAFHYLKRSTEIKKSYKEFFEDVASLSNYFIKSGYKRTHCAILGENSYEWLVSFFAIVNSDNIAVPLDKEMSKESISEIVRRSDTSVLIYSDTYKEEAEYNNGINLINMLSLPEIIDENKTGLCSKISFYENIKIDNDATCAIVYTSGTTSEPKGAMLSHKNIASDAVYTQMNSTVPDSSMLVLPLYHMYAIILAISVPMLVGSSIFINKSIKTLMSDILYCKPKYMAVVPLMLEAFYKKITESIKGSGKEEIINKLLKISNALRKVGPDFRRKFFAKIIDAFGGRLELIAVGGAPINEKIVTALTDFGIQVLGGYGTTECSPIVSSVRNKHFNPGSVGFIVPNVEARIVDDEIQIKGDIVFSGYYKDEQLTREVFDGEWYKTGDLGYFENGFLFINGRCKNLIVLSNGENVSPEGLELLLQNNIPEIGEVLVYSEADIIVAEIFTDVEDSETKIREKIDSINRTLPSYKHISKVIFRDKKFEKTTTNKIKRKYK